MAARPPTWGGGVLPASCLQAARRNATNKSPPPESGRKFIFKFRNTLGRTGKNARARAFNVKCLMRRPGRREPRPAPPGQPRTDPGIPSRPAA